MNTVTEVTAQSEQDTPQAVVVDIALPQEPVIERSPENDGIYRAIRAEIHAELSLITARVNWLIASQAFLFMPLTIGTPGASLGDSLLFPLIPVLGLILCVLILVSILAAVWRSQQWRRKARQGDYRGEIGRHDFSIVLPHTPAIPYLGFAGGIGVPVVLIATWAFVLVMPPVAG
ncbi:MAG: hypothetical protein HKP29_04365 [Silicimonas sp.]|nr:hypothetical protein [Silicimonas sp.]RZW07168.1 MAG: hypothetical protein EX266_06660 [Paracoccaceae bacterium]NND22099.1 hypothetical protein [Silicimonas sp.]NND42712.1 hypothetical protein [Silicimonas sp.]NNL35055.1 hypothetical protein [Silicimonas sp.]